MRKPMVTRTIISTKATVLCVNAKTAETFEQEFILSGKIDDKTIVLKRLRKDYSSDNCVIVAVKELSSIEALYGMSESYFIANAVMLDPSTRKPIEADTETTETSEPIDAE